VVIWRATRFILTSPGRRIGLRRDATRAPTQRPEWRGGGGRPQEESPFGGGEGKTQGFGGGTPQLRKASCRIAFAPEDRTAVSSLRASSGSDSFCAPAPRAAFERSEERR